MKRSLPSNSSEAAASPSAMVLGTAQVGMRYGAANIVGQPELTAAIGIVEAVWNRGVRFFDTAPSYGTSEEILGRAFANLSPNREAQVVSKLMLDSSAPDPEAIIARIQVSLRRLGIPRLWGLLLHDENQLDQWDSSLGNIFARAKQAGLVSHVGVSAYSPRRALQALATDGLDLLQVPANVFDRRMQRAGVFSRARERGKTVFVRSIYLQGLVLMKLGTVPVRIPEASKAIATLRRFCDENQLNLHQFGLDFVRWMAPDARVVIGAETIAQAIENCSLFEQLPVDLGIQQEWTERWPRDIDGLIDPRSWE